MPSSTMNANTIHNFIADLERENAKLREVNKSLVEELKDYKKIRSYMGDPDSYDESRNKIENLKKLLTRAEQERVRALEELNSYRNNNKSSLYESTARVTEKCEYPVAIVPGNQGLVIYFTELGDNENDYFKSVAYRKAAEIIADLTDEVLSGESLLHIKGIGKSIASKIDEFIEDLDSDYSEEESVASNDVESFASSEPLTDDDYVISYNSDLSSMLNEVADEQTDPFKKRAYRFAATRIFDLPFKVTSGEQVSKGPNKIVGIGKGIAKRIDDYLNEENFLEDK